MPFDFNALDHEFFMREALKEAELSLQEGERPIGAVIVHNNKVIGRGRAQHLRVVAPVGLGVVAHLCLRRPAPTHLRGVPE